MKIFSKNRKAEFNYDILEKFEAGIVLLGTEVKSIKSGNIHLDGSFVIFNGDELFLTNTEIPAWQEKNAPSDYNKSRERKLLLTKKEINHIINKKKEGKISLIPLLVFEKNRKIKVEIGICRGKNKINKKEVIKERDIQRETNRVLKN